MTHWGEPLAEPVEAPGRQLLRSLKDAGQYLVALPGPLQQHPNVIRAAARVMDAAASGEPDAIATATHALQMMMLLAGRALLGAQHPSRIKKVPRKVPRAHAGKS